MNHRFDKSAPLSRLLSLPPSSLPPPIFVAPAPHSREARGYPLPAKWYTPLGRDRAVTRIIGWVMAALASVLLGGDAGLAAIGVLLAQEATRLAGAVR
jgi:hypothetical protein